MIPKEISIGMAGFAYRAALVWEVMTEFLAKEKGIYYGSGKKVIVGKSGHY